MEELNYPNGTLWDTFKVLFLQEFFPVDSKREMETRFINLTQGGKTVAEYVAEFQSLSKYAPYMVTTEEARIVRFVQGLRKEVQYALLTSLMTSFPVTVATAKRAEKLRNDIRDERVVGTKRPAETINRSGGPPMTKRPMTTQPPVICGYCNKPGHVRKECRSALGLCVICGSKDHAIQGCPRRYDRTPTNFGGPIQQPPRLMEPNQRMPTQANGQHQHPPNRPPFPQQAQQYQAGRQQGRPPQHQQRNNNQIMAYNLTAEVDNATGAATDEDVNAKDDIWAGT